MAFNIIDFVKDQISADNLRAIAGALGEDQDKVGSALSKATPAILAGLVSKLGQPQGRQDLEKAIEDTDAGILDNVSDVLGGANSGGLMETGAKVLGGLLGSGNMGSLAGALSKSSDLSDESSASLLSLAAPLVLGALKRKANSDGLNMGGLMDLLTGQKAQIADALPEGLGKELAGTGLLQGVMDSGNQASAAASRAGAAVTSATSEAAAGGSSLIRKLLPIAIVVVAALAIYQWLSSSSGTAPQGHQGAAAGMAEEMAGLMDNTVSTLRSIDSVESARAAVDDLESIDNSLGTLVEKLAGATDSGSQMVATAVSRAMPTVQAAAESARQIPGVGDVIGESLDAIERKLERLARG